jgi:hypothetical protein
MDFTIGTYKSLLNNMKSQGFSFLSFEDFISHREGKIIIIRHDVDKLPANKATGDWMHRSALNHEL